jgi:hypothetical protein
VTPGWYSDPNGGPDLRWWDGSTWTEHTSPAVGTPVAAAAVYVAEPPPAPVLGGAPGGPPPLPGPAAGPSGGYPAPPGGPGGDSKRGLLIAGGTAAAVLLGVGGFVVLSGGDDETTSGTTTTTATADETATTHDTSGTTTTGPTGSTITPDPNSEQIASGGLTFARLDGWEDWATQDRGQITELEGTAGQFVVVQEVSPTGGQWIGNILIGSLGDSVIYNGEDALPATTHTLAEQIIGSYYVENPQAAIQNEQAVTIDGHPGYFVHYELSFLQEGLETTREKVIVVVVDTGQERPGVFWASIPYNRADLNAGMDEAYASLRVPD